MKHEKHDDPRLEEERFSAHAGLTWKVVFAVSGVLTLTILGMTPLMALAEAPNSTDESQAAGALEEIVVTAQRRSENLEHTPVTVVVLTSKALDQQAVLSESDLQIAVPGLTVRTANDSTAINFSIRGQTLDLNTGSQPAVQPYMNEVPVTANLSTAFYDMDSIQVLKGPQGTLFGRNATGGAILFTTAKPTDDFGGYVTSRLGDYNQQEIQGAVNIPLIGNEVILRLAGDLDRRDGFTYNIFDGSTLGDVRRESFRASLLIRPTTGLTNTLVVDYGHTGGTPTPAVLYGVYAPGSTNNGIPLNSSTSALYSPALGSIVGVPGAWTTYLAAHPSTYAGGLAAYLPIQQALGPFKVDDNIYAPATKNNLTTSNITALDVSEGMQIRNIFGFASSRTNTTSDIDGTAYEIESSQLVFDTETLTDELQLLGNAFDHKLSYVGGLFYDGTLKNNNGTYLRYFDLAPIIPVTNVAYIANFTGETLAAYEQGTYDLSTATGISGLSFTEGFRYTSDKVTEYILPGSVLYDTPGLPNQVSSTAKKPSWQFGAEWQANTNLLLYAETRHSFRSGGFNPYSEQLPGNASSGGNGFAPETATDVEAGIKFQGTLAGVPTRTNLALYTEWVDNVQRIIYVDKPGVGVIGLTENVPQAEVRGVELSLQLNPVSWLEFGGNVAYANAAFTKNVAQVFGQTIIFGPYPDTPRWSGTVFAQVSEPLPDSFGMASLRADSYSQSVVYYSSYDGTINPGAVFRPYTIVNFRLGLDNIKGSHFSLDAHVKNAFNRIYYTGGNPVGSTESFNSAVPGDPRTFFVEGRYDF